MFLRNHLNHIQFWCMKKACINFSLLSYFLQCIFISSTHTQKINMRFKGARFPTGWTFSCKTLKCLMTLFSFITCSQENDNIKYWLWFQSHKFYKTLLHLSLLTIQVTHMITPHDI